MSGTLSDIGPIVLRAAQKKEDVSLFNEYLHRYHYLGYKRPFGCHLRYFIEAQGAILGCMLFSGAARALTSRDHGMTIPLMSEILSYTKGDTGDNKQDCELKAFYRLASRLKKAFPALKIMLLLDGLYAKGPVAEICRKNKWQFMIVLNEVNRESGKPEEKNSRHVWLSSEPLNKFNLHERCNLVARSRWCIESSLIHHLISDFNVKSIS